VQKVGLSLNLLGGVRVVLLYWLTFWFR